MKAENEATANREAYAAEKEANRIKEEKEEAARQEREKAREEASARIMAEMKGRPQPRP